MKTEMINADKAKTVLVLNTVPELEEDLIDYLLAQSLVSGFTSYSVRGHGEHIDMSTSEQVTGRRKRVQFEIILNEIDVMKVIEGLASEVGRDISYWQLAVMNVGRV